MGEAFAPPMDAVSPRWRGFGSGEAGRGSKERRKDEEKRDIELLRSAAEFFKKAVDYFRQGQTALFELANRINERKAAGTAELKPPVGEGAFTGLRPHLQRWYLRHKEDAALDMLQEMTELGLIKEEEVAEIWEKREHERLHGDPWLTLDSTRKKYFSAPMNHHRASPAMLRAMAKHGVITQEHCDQVLKEKEEREKRLRENPPTFEQRLPGLRWRAMFEGKLPETDDPGLKKGPSLFKGLEKKTK